MPFNNDLLSQMYSSVSPPAQAQRQEEDDLQRGQYMLCILSNISAMFYVKIQ